MYRDYRNKDVNFYYVYSNIQHPETNGIVEAYNLQERLMHIKEMIRRSQSEMPWLCDNMSQDLKTALKAAPNGEYIFDPQGKLIRKRFWSEPNTLRTDMEELFGKVEKPTKVSDLPTRFTVEPRKIASGVVPPVRLSGRMTVLTIRPESDDAKVPYYVKLRAEVTQSALRGGKGTLFLGFYLDPLYKVHWNNKMKPIQVSIDGKDSIELKKKDFVGPKVKEPADIDPRQFLVEIDVKEPANEFSVSVSYVACDDAETFCLPVTQTYTVSFTPDRFGGTRPSVFLDRLFANIRGHDKNKDGEITADELPKGRVTMFVGHLDKNNDGKIDEQEIKEFEQMFNNGKGFSRPKKGDKN